MPLAVFTFSLGLQHNYIHFRHTIELLPALQTQGHESVAYFISNKENKEEDPSNDIRFCKRKTMIVG